RRRHTRSYGDWSSDVCSSDLGGVTVIDPATTWIDSRAWIGGDTVIEPFSYIAGDASIGCDCRIGPFAYVAAGSRIGDGATVGPTNGHAQPVAMGTQASGARA